MNVSEIIKDVKALQSRMMALEFIVQSMLRTLSESEKKELITELEKINYDIPAVHEALELSKRHINNKL
ncbi:hypothetical protein FE392_10970 [Xenorhabdus sp. 12]|uniref:Phage protein n=1 Tax=Xenorhabdus santafensis TaxID=2582833 RepID=A0ABU4SAL3_9GAMM|nr:hypothetical protein [Xenorhabdus sp. 12]MDX7987848.1 hypothetical protein [Xenorhabdus sp. 12]